MGAGCSIADPVDVRFTASDGERWGTTPAFVGTVGVLDQALPSPAVGDSTGDRDGRCVEVDVGPARGAQLTSSGAEDGVELHDRQRLEVFGEGVDDGVELSVSLWAHGRVARTRDLGAGRDVAVDPLELDGVGQGPMEDPVGTFTEPGDSPGASVWCQAAMSRRRRSPIRRSPR